MTTHKVFISYSQDSDEHKDKVLQLADRLRNDGIDANIDQYQTNPPEGWQLWMEKQIRDSQFVILVCTETYLKRVMKEDEGRGKGVMWESTIAYSYLYESGVVNEKFIPVVFGYENTKNIPMPLKPTTFYDVSTEKGYEALYRRLTNQPYTTKPELGKLKSLPRRERKTNSPDVQISLAHLPSTSPDLFGRENELKELDDAWANPQINVMTLVAWGGVGKSALVNKWLTQMARDNYRGAERVYGWSFYSQGAAEGRQVSADQFIASALAWFGDPDPNVGSPWDKGERLAELVKGSRALIILDGLEPLQNPPPVETGRIKDPALVAFLRELARQNRGLVLITTRLAVDDLKDCIGSTALERDLEALSDEAGADYLKHLGIDGTENERKEASHDFGGHALALTLMGSYLKTVHRGDIRKRKEIPHLTDDQKQGAHARRVLESYERWLQGKPELDILRLMGLFDRPAEKGALDALRKKLPTKEKGLLGAIKDWKNMDVIKGLTDNIHKLSDKDWQFALQNLRDLRLIAQEDPHEPDTLDYHPLLREHFGEQLKETNPAAWREGNNRLYEYYKASAKELPDTLQEMAPLFAAVMHGCQAGRYQEAHDEIYFKRIRRKNEYFIIKKLGAMGSDLSVVASFFERTWSKPIEKLNANDRGILLNHAGYCLRALGRLAEAAQPTQESLEMHIEQEFWKSAAITASNLSELYLTLGDVTHALAYAEQSVQFADQSADEFSRMIGHTTLADALHQAGQLLESETTFREAEGIQQQNRWWSSSMLVAIWGFKYCDLLFEKGQSQDIEERAKKSIAIGEPINWDLLSIALDYLSLGRTHLLQSQQTSNVLETSEVPQTLTYLTRAVDGLRQAGQQDELPRGLLARGEYYRVVGDFVRAQRDLDEAFSIATRGGMGLFLADCHLGYARLHVEKLKGLNVQTFQPDNLPTDFLEARKHLSTAKEMIDKMGYHRRDKEVEELEKELK